MIEYWRENYPIMLIEMGQHAEIVFAALAIAITVTIILVLVFLHRRNWLNGLVYFFSLLYSVPSFALFALLLPVTGLGMWTAIVVLAVYCEYVLLRSFITGIQEVTPAMVEVARGMGMTNRQVFMKVQLPLAVPAIFSGIQVALASAMGIATIATTINAGGLGELLFEGLQTQKVTPILWGTVLTIVLTLTSAGILRLVEWAFDHRWRRVLTAKKA